LVYGGHVVLTFFGFSVCFFKGLSFSMADQWKTAGPKTTHESTFGARAKAMQTFWANTDNGKRT
jgi:hypothetical protein